MNRRNLFDVHLLWKMFKENKKWFMLSVVSCLFLGLLYIYFARPAFSVSGKILITEKKTSSSSNVSNVLLSSQIPLGLGSNLGGSVGVENEKEILRSKLLAKNVVNRLGLYTEYRINKYLKGRLVYRNQPINVEVPPQLLQFLDDELPLTMHSISLSIHKSDDGFNIEGFVQSGKKKTKLKEQQFNELPFTVNTNIGNLRLSENKDLDSKQLQIYAKDYRMDLKIIPPSTAAIIFSKEISINTASKKATNTINLSMKDESILRSFDYINCLVEEYNNFSTEEKHKEVSKYDQFVKNRLAMVDEELGLNDDSWEKYKKQYLVTDLKVDAEEVMKKKSSYEAQIVGLGIQLQLLDYLKEYVNDPANTYEIIPVNLGFYVSSTAGSIDASSLAVGTGDAITLIGRHNARVYERNLMLKSNTEKSPHVMQVTALIDELHPMIKTALKRDIESLRLRSKTLELEYNKYLSKVADAPEQERMLTEIGRQRKVKEGVYLSLLQKREENAMDMMNTVDKGRFIDMVQYNRKVKPRPLIVLFLALLMGGLLPFIYMYLRRWLRGTIGNYDDLISLTSLPVLGVFPDQNNLSDDYFRMLRTQFLHQIKTDGKVALFTSYACEDLKTDTALHLAESLSHTGQKVLVCDVNLRHPMVDKMLSITNSKGLCDIIQQTTALSSQTLSEQIVHCSSKGFDVLVAGNAQSVHPADLLSYKRITTVMERLREMYDLIILDSASLAEYSDTLEIAGLADLTCFVCCTGITPKSIIAKLSDGFLPSPCLILNDKKS